MLEQHHIEEFGNGAAAFATARQDAWHQLGTVTSSCMSAEEVLNLAYLGGWNVRKLPLTATEITKHGVSQIDIPDRFATVRTHPVTQRPDYFGTVGNGYVIKQNEQQVELLNALIDESGAHFETAGSLRGGTQTFVTMKMPKGMRIAGTDDIDLYLVVLNSHDGSTAFKVLVTPTRVVCANTQRIAINKTEASHSIRHTKSAAIKIAEIREKLGLIWDCCEAFEAEAERMVNAELSTVQFKEVIGQLWPVNSNAPARTRNNAERRTSDLMRLWRSADTQAAIRGTRWAGLQTVAEYLDHYSPAKNDDVRATRVLTSDALADRKQRAYELLGV